MSVIVTDTGFHPEHWRAGFVPLARLASCRDATGLAVDVATWNDPEALRPWLHAIAMVRVRFDTFSDGRGFALAARLRQMGFDGRLRAAGHLLADQYTMMRRCGFDEVEISAELAHRQPEEHWKFRGNWRHHDYRSRLTV